MSTPLKEMADRLKQGARDVSETRLREAFSGSDRAEREDVAARFRVQMARWRKVAGEEVWAACEAALTEAVETSDASALVEVMNKVIGMAPAGGPQTIGLKVDVRCSPEVRGDAGDTVVVMFPAPRGSGFDVVGRSELDADGAATIQLSRLPKQACWHALPKELGGPYHFALGWIGLAKGAEDSPDAGTLIAYDKNVRVLALSGTFPVAGLRRFIDEHGLPPGAGDADVDAMLADLVGLGDERGLVLTRVPEPTMSLMGFAKADDAVATLAREPWPPKHF